MITLGILESSSVSQGVTSDALSLWQFNETSGTTAVDEQGNNDGTISANVALNQTGYGNIGTSFGFSHADAEVDLGGIHLGTDDFSIAVWCRMDSIGDGLERLIIGNDPTENGWIGFYLSTAAATSNVQFKTYNGGAVNVLTTFSMNDANWHLIIATRSSTELEVFVDNVSRGTTAATPVKDLTNAENMKVSHTDRASFREFLGEVGQLHIYNKVLDSGEMDVIWNAGSGVDY